MNLWVCRMATRAFWTTEMVGEVAKRDREQLPRVEGLWTVGKSLTVAAYVWGRICALVPKVGWVEQWLAWGLRRAHLGNRPLCFFCGQLYRAPVPEKNGVELLPEALLCGKCRVAREFVIEMAKDEISHAEVMGSSDPVEAAGRVKWGLKASKAFEKTMEG